VDSLANSGPGAPMGGDLISRVFYSPRYPRDRDRQVRLASRSSRPGTYVFRLDVRSGAYDGTLIASANGSAILPGGFTFVRPLLPSSAKRSERNSQPGDVLNPAGRRAGRCRPGVLRGPVRRGALRRSGDRDERHRPAAQHIPPERGVDGQSLGRPPRPHRSPIQGRCWPATLNGPANGVVYRTKTTMCWLRNMAAIR